MINLVRAELSRRTRSMWLLAGLALLFCVGWTITQALVFLRPGTAPEKAVDAVYSMAQQGYIFAMIIGIILVTGEYRHRTITWAFLVTPRRGQVITAKLLASSVIGLVIGLASALVTIPVAAILLASKDYPAFTPSVPVVLLGCVLSTVLWCLFGAGLGALIRNMVAAITFAFVWFFYAEWLLVMLVPSVGRWTPTGAGKAVGGWTRDALSSGPFAAGDLLPVWAGGLVLIGYAVAAAVTGRWTSIRGDA